MTTRGWLIASAALAWFGLLYFAAWYSIDRRCSDDGPEDAVCLEPRR